MIAAKLTSIMALYLILHLIIATGLFLVIMGGVITIKDIFTKNKRAVEIAIEQGEVVAISFIQQ